MGSSSSSPDSKDRKKSSNKQSPVSNQADVPWTVISSTSRTVPASIYTPELSCSSQRIGGPQAGDGVSGMRKSPAPQPPQWQGCRPKEFPTLERQPNRSNPGPSQSEVFDHFKVERSNQFNSASGSQVKSEPALGNLRSKPEPLNSKKHEPVLGGSSANGDQFNRVKHDLTKRDLPGSLASRPKAQNQVRSELTMENVRFNSGPPKSFKRHDTAQEGSSGNGLSAKLPASLKLPTTLPDHMQRCLSLKKLMKDGSLDSEDLRAGPRMLSGYFQEALKTFAPRSISPSAFELFLIKTSAGLWCQLNFDSKRSYKYCALCSFNTSKLIAWNDHLTGETHKNNDDGATSIWDCGKCGLLILGSTGFIESSQADPIHELFDEIYLAHKKNVHEVFEQPAKATTEPAGCSIFFVYPHTEVLKRAPVSKCPSGNIGKWLEKFNDGKLGCVCELCRLNVEVAEIPAHLARHTVAQNALLVCYSCQGIVLNSEEKIESHMMKHNKQALDSPGGYNGNVRIYKLLSTSDISLRTNIEEAVRSCEIYPGIWEEKSPVRADDILCLFHLANYQVNGKTTYSCLRCDFKDKLSGFVSHLTSQHYHLDEGESHIFLLCPFCNLLASMSSEKDIKIHAISGAHKKALSQNLDKQEKINTQEVKEVISPENDLIARYKSQWDKILVYHIHEPKDKSLNEPSGKYGLIKYNDDSIRSFLTDLLTENCTLSCISCQENFGSLKKLIDHVSSAQHLKKPSIGIVVCSLCSSLTFISNRVPHSCLKSTPETKAQNVRPLAQKGRWRREKLQEKRSINQENNANEISTSLYELHIISKDGKLSDAPRPIPKKYQASHHADYASLLHDLVTKDLKESIRKIYCAQCRRASPNLKLFQHQHLASQAHQTSTMNSMRAMLCQPCNELGIFINDKDLFFHLRSKEHKRRMKCEDREGPGSDDESVSSASSLASRQDSASVCSNAIPSHIRDASRAAKTLKKVLENELHSLLGYELPKTQIHFFGSRELGISSGSSPIDLYIDPGGHYSGENKDLQGFEVILRSLKSPSSPLKVMNDPIIGRDIKLHTKHTASSTSCCVFFGDGSFVERTKLVKTLMNLDERIGFALVAAREWSLKSDLIQYMPNVYIDWLMIFFLMQPVCQLVPSIKTIMEVYSGPRTLLNGTDISFETNIERIRRSFNPEKCTRKGPEILSLFFEFYSIIAFSDVVLSPLDGKVLPREMFKFPQSLPPGYPSGLCHMLDVFDSVILVDPLSRLFNIVKDVTPQGLMYFKTLCESLVVDSD